MMGHQHITQYSHDPYIAILKKIINGLQEIKKQLPVHLKYAYIQFEAYNTQKIESMCRKKVNRSRLVI